MGSAGQLARSFRRRGPSHRRDEQPALSTPVVLGVALISIVCRSGLSTIIALLLWSVLPNLVGFQTTTVMSGSMEPRLTVGDAVVVRRIDAADLAPGQILLFDDPDHPGRLRMHRLVQVGSDGRLVTRGDANEQRDSSTIGFDAVHGAGFLRIPYAGLPTYWIRTGQTIPLIAGGAIVLVLLGGVRSGRLLEGDEHRSRRRHRGVRLPGVHRAAAVGTALIVLSGLATQTAPARAAYTAAAVSGTNTWGTGCVDRAPSTGAVPASYYGYGPGTGATDIPDIGLNGDTATFRPGATRSTCANGRSPYASFDGVSGVVNASRSWPHPTSMTLATWFKVNPGDAGGVLADFGSSSTAAASSGVDDGLYMGDTGRLTFGAASIQAAGLVQSNYRYCTTAAGYADGSWHLAVATVSTTAGCTLTIDADPSTTVATPFTIAVVLGAFSGSWRMGYDTAATGTNAPSRFFFRGALDETQIYTSVVPFSVQTTIWNNGR